MFETFIDRTRDLFRMAAEDLNIITYKDFVPVPDKGIHARTVITRGAEDSVTRYIYDNGVLKFAYTQRGRMLDKSGECDLRRDTLFYEVDVPQSWTLKAYGLVNGKETFSYTIAYNNEGYKEHRLFLAKSEADSLWRPHFASPIADYRVIEPVDGLPDARHLTPEDVEAICQREQIHLSLEDGARVKKMSQAERVGYNAERTRDAFIRHDQMEQMAVAIDTMFKMFAYASLMFAFRRRTASRDAFILTKKCRHGRNEYGDPVCLTTGENSMRRISNATLRHLIGKQYSILTNGMK